jgi:signal transduction histidine kinase
LALAVVVFLFYYPHVHSGPHAMHHILQSWSSTEHLLEGSTYLLIGGLTGYLIDRIRREEARLRVALAQLRGGAGELFEAEEQLRRADRLAALGQLTTGLAHEIRNPLGSIRGAAEILGDPQTDDARRREFARVLVEETERLDDVLGNFLDYARTHREEEATGTSDPRAVVERLLALMDKELKAARIAARVDLPQDAPRVAIGEALLQQVLLNLSLNAVQAMPDGGELRIEGIADAAGGGLMLAVADTGPGIAADARARVFDPFYTTKATGSGLGLSIVHKIVTANGGQVAVDEDYRGGARLVVTLPTA